MTISQIIILIAIVILLPAGIGLAFVNKEEGVLLPFVYGLITEWAVFFIVTIPAIITKKTLSLVIRISGFALLIILVCCVLCFVRETIKRKKDNIRLFSPDILSKSEMVFLGLFLALWGFQIYKSVFYAFNDGDDAFYVAAAQVTAASDSMYVMNPYFGGDNGGITFRYALAPFSMWIAAIARLSGVNASAVAHTVLPPVLISVTYIIFNGISKKLFGAKREKRYMFMVLYAIYVTFSNVSQSMPETFMITRSRQGKAALADIIIPMMIYIALEIFNREKNAEVGRKDLLKIVLLSLAGSLTSVFANILFPIMLFGFFIIAFIKKSSVAAKIRIAMGVLPSFAILALYLIKG